MGPLWFDFGALSLKFWLPGTVTQTQPCMSLTHLPSAPQGDSHGHSAISLPQKPGVLDSEIYFLDSLACKELTGQRIG